MATAPTIGSRGEELNLLIKQGSTFGPMTVSLQNPDESVMDITACVIRGQVRRNALDANPAVTAFTCTITDAPNGVFEFGLTDEVTAAITADESISKPGSKYVWDMELEDSVGSVTPLFWGVVTVFREVTRP